MELFNSDEVEMARGFLYLYHAPFSPSILYERGAEHFVLQRGWGVLRSRQGLLAWMELSTDSHLREAALLSAPLAASTEAVPPRPLPVWSLRIAQHYGVNPSAEQALRRSCEVTLLGTCTVDGPVRIPSEDVAVCYPSGSASALWIKLGSPQATFDDIFKGWLSACSVRI